MDRIIVGYDRSPAAKAALAFAAYQARLRDATLTVYTVHPHAAKDPELHAELGRLTDYPLDHRVLQGRPATELIAAAADADQLIIGARGHRSPVDPRLGSVSRACLHATPCPIIVVHAHHHPHRDHAPVIAGVDGSQHSRDMLRHAAVEARLRATDLLAVHAYRYDPLGPEESELCPSQLTDHARRMLDHELTRAGIDRARCLIEAGHPADVLVAHSRRADLLVVGSHGHRPLTDLLLGSVSRHCAEYAHCPVMVVPAGPPRRERSPSSPS